MSDDTQNEENEINEEHPWVQASMLMNPQPVPAGVELDAVTLNAEGEQSTRAAMLNIIDPTGIKNVFLPPPLLEYLFKSAADILRGWSEEDAQERAKNPPIILGTSEELRAAKEAEKTHRHLKGI